MTARFSSTAASTMRAITTKCVRSISALALLLSPCSSVPSPRGSDRLLAVDGINTFYGKSHILNAVSFDVRKHEIVALLGRNGAGKSTLLKSLIGIARPEAGSIKLLGPGDPRPASAEIARRGIGYVPQGRGLFAGMTVADNLVLGRLKRSSGAGIRWDDERIVAIFPRLG